MLLFFFFLKNVQKAVEPPFCALKWRLRRTTRIPGRDFFLRNALWGKVTAHREGIPVSDWLLAAVSQGCVRSSGILIGGNERRCLPTALGPKTDD